MATGFVGPISSEEQSRLDRLEELVTAQGLQLETQISDFQKQLNDQRSDFQKQLDLVHEQTTVPFICNVAAQCLNKALGRSRAHTPSHVFVDAAAASRGDPHQVAIKELVKDIYGRSAYRRRARALDTILDRRNQQAHMDDNGVVLAEAVERALRYINASPSVLNACQEEMVVLGKFQDDPDRFDPI